MELRPFSPGILGWLMWVLHLELGRVLQSLVRFRIPLPSPNTLLERVCFCKIHSIEKQIKTFALCREIETERQRQGERSQ